MANERDRRPEGPHAVENPAVLNNSVVLDRFVVLEGLDGAGTTTQLGLLGDRLSCEGVPHWCTGEPTPGAIGLQIRSILKRELRVHPCTVALLFAADRNEHLHEPGGGIMARLRRGEIVISDRYLFSSLAYQSLGCSFEYVRRINDPFPLPRLVVFVDTPVRLSQERLSRRQSASAGGGGAGGQDTVERGMGELFDAASIQQDILAAYERSFNLFSATGMQVHRVDGSLSTPEVFEKIWTILRSLPIL